jgi:hypothetical protein
MSGQEKTPAGPPQGSFPAAPEPGAGLRPGVETPLRERPPEPPVVARLVVEIRSDGSRTIARGALEDTTTGERTVLEAHGDTPLALMLSLSRALVKVPALARKAARKLLGPRS